MRRHALELHVAALQMIFGILLEELGADQTSDTILVGKMTTTPPPIPSCMLGNYTKTANASEGQSLRLN
jgi:hypothetical protein